MSENPTRPDGLRVVTLGPDGMPTEASGSGVEEADAEESVLSEMVEQPAKVMRIGTMIKQLLEEVRAAQAQLVGWLEGLFHGIQTALFAQQMAARAQLEEMRRRALPAGMSPPGGQQPSGPYL